jgi:chemotaxis protein methyltransferase CheR
VDNIGKSPLEKSHIPPDYVRLAQLIEERTGLFFDNSRGFLFSDKIAPLVAERGFTSVEDYYYFLRYDPQAEEEWKRVHSALAVNETFFWREYDQIRATVETIIPALRHKHPGKPVRVWHAACASGEEAYTFAISLAEAGLSAGAVEIIATDFNPNALLAARKGIYRQRAFRSIPPAILAKYFQPVGKDHYQIVERISSRVDFRFLNLLDENAMTLMNNFDVIFCRNVFIYFSENAIRRVIERFDRSLNPDGTLFVASAESLLRLTTRFDLVEIGSAFGYQKRRKQN